MCFRTYCRRPCGADDRMAQVCTKLHLKSVRTITISSLMSVRCASMGLLKRPRAHPSQREQHELFSVQHMTSRIRCAHSAPVVSWRRLVPRSLWTSRWQPGTVVETKPTAYSSSYLHTQGRTIVRIIRVARGQA